ncbi:peptidoglycan DD-metalloendopeptidase family protein [Paenibacillus sp. CAU 1782]
MKWMSKRFTLVFIPDANQSVRRYSVSASLLVLIPAIFILLAACSALFIYLFTDNQAVIGKLTGQIAASQEQHAEELSDKINQIATLESDLAVLAEQAREIESKMIDIAELEAQLKDIAGIESSEVQISSALTEESGGQGGEEFPLPQMEQEHLAKQTIEDFSALSQLMEELKPSLEKTKEAMLQYQHIQDITPTIWPADSRKITSTFGVRRDPFTGRTSLHSGLDLGGSRGDPIYAAADGVITLSENTYPQGNNIIVDHGRGIKTRYLHLNKRLVEVGDTVTKGQQIGELGNTGRSTGPHLHYEVFVNGTNVNPMPYLKEDRKESE